MRQPFGCDWIHDCTSAWRRNLQVMWLCGRELRGSYLLRGV